MKGIQREIGLYFPAEGFGETYRRVMVNRFFERLLTDGGIRSVAEYPVDPYGVDGAGSLVFAAHGCDLTFVSDRQDVLDRVRALFDSIGLNGSGESAQVHFVVSDLAKTPVADDYYDLSWSFDRIHLAENPEAVLREIARASKAVMVMVPNAGNYGQFAHWLYHKAVGGACDYVGPNRWMSPGPVRAALEAAGLEIVDEGLIDVPLWPGFPELPGLVRRLLGRPLPPASAGQIEAYPSNDAVEQTAQRVALIESSKLPYSVRQAFAHAHYVLAVKPTYRSSLGSAAARTRRYDGDHEKDGERKPEPETHTSRGGQPMKFLRSAFALIAWLAIWVPTTLFVLFVLIRDIIRDRSKAGERSGPAMNASQEAGADA